MSFYKYKGVVILKETTACAVWLLATDGRVASGYMRLFISLFDKDWMFLNLKNGKMGMLSGYNFNLTKLKVQLRYVT